MAARRGRWADTATVLALITVAMWALNIPVSKLALDDWEPLAFSLVLRRKIPAIFGVVLLLSIWPGMPMTDSMLRTWSTWYDSLPSWATQAWYVPLMVLPLPWMWLSWVRSSRRAANEQAKVQLETITTVLRDAMAA